MRTESAGKGVLNHDAGIVVLEYRWNSAACSFSRPDREAAQEIAPRRFRTEEHAGFPVQLDHLVRKFRRLIRKKVGASRVQNEAKGLFVPWFPYLGLKS